MAAQQGAGVGLGHDPVELLVEAGDDRVWRAGRHGRAKPLAEVDAGKALSASVGVSGSSAKRWAVVTA